jgi:hypothetical protein
MSDTMAPAMTQAEQALLRAAASGAARMLEFGCGGSTALLLDAGRGCLLSVDSDADWLARVARHNPGTRLAQHHADLGPCGEWGWPLLKPEPVVAWRYWGAPWLAMPEADLVLVDGRYRVACALAAHGRLAPSGHLAMHDFWPRHAYRDALAPFFEVVGSAGTLALLRPVPAEGLAEARRVHAADAR